MKAPPVISLVATLCLWATGLPVEALVSEYTVANSTVRLKGVGPDSPSTEDLKRFIRTDLGRANQLGAGALTPQAGLAVTALGKHYQPDPRRVVIQQSHADPGGSTSIRNHDRAHLVWKTHGYFQRNRDLGQVFTAPRDFQLDAVVLRTGPSDAAVLAGAPGAKLFAQFFEVIGEPRIHDNGTPPGTEAKHGFSRNHRCDDYLTGVEYRPLCVANGGSFPALAPTRALDGRPSGDDSGRLVYLRWRFTGMPRPGFTAGRRYAFMLGIEEPGTARGFTLANANAAGVNAASSLTDAHDRHHGGWGLRREGDGTLPPTMLPGEQPPDDPARLAPLHREALFAEGSSRYSLSPTTDGFPDVDTYRDLEFYLEAVDPSPPLVQHDLTPLHDAQRVLVNPHKGWYHHYPDNHINKYKIARDTDLLEFPGMDHLYIRLAWAYLEPKEGQFDWGVIDRLIDKWTAHGLGVAFRISCKETSTDRIEQQFATPRWVMEAGAQGGYYRMGKATGPEGPWEPAFDDPVFLAKLDRFLAAFAARYDRQPWVRYVDIGSIGDWGEGHSWAGSRQECGLATRKRHVDLHLKHFKHAPLVVSDDFVYALSNPTERAALHRYVLTNGISYRDDSIMVDGYFSGTSKSHTVRSPEFFADAFPRTPTVLELEHYGHVKRLGNWDGRAGSNVAKFGKGKKGPDFFRGALEHLHASYIGYHGYAHEWLADNPELTKELLNRCGYWLFPASLALPEKAATGATIPITLTLENRGVAPPYLPYELRVKLSGAGTNWVRVMGQANKSWLPGTPVVCPCDLPLPAALPPGQYQVAIGLLDAAPSKARPVEFALQAGLRDDAGYYRMATLKLTAP